jgi:predicted MFS family arabinose efflux permease
LVDGTKHKRALMTISALVIIAAAVAILFVPSFPANSGSQIATGIAGTVVAPAIAGITLGLVKQAGFAHQLGRNEAFNHAGNVFAALAGGGLGYIFGLRAIFCVMAAMAAGSIIAVMAIKPQDIDHRAARGLSQGADSAQSSFAALLTCTPLVILAMTLALFHLGNAAMLPLLGQALVTRGAGDPSAYTAATIVVAQLTMIPMALLAARLAQTRGYWIVLVLALVALPIRGLIAAFVTSPWGLVPIQILDGVGAGLLDVATPGLTARILAGTGHVNVGLGAVMTMQAVGAASSPALAGLIAQRLGYGSAFLALGAIATVALVLWLAATRIVAPACREPPEELTATAAA